MTIKGESVAQRLAIESTLYSYVHGIDHEWWTMFFSAFAENAQIDAPDIGPEIDSPASLRESVIRSSGPDLISRQHLISNISIGMEADIVSSFSSFSQTVVRFTTESDHLIARTVTNGIHSDEIHRTDSGWRIVHRRIMVKSRFTNALEYDHKRISMLMKARPEIKSRQPSIGLIYTA